MKPFDKSESAIVKLYRGDFASQTRLGEDENCDSLLLAFQHELRFDKENDCYFVCAHDRHAPASFYFFSNAFGVFPVVDVRDDGMYALPLDDKTDYLRTADLRERLEMARMLFELNRRLAFDESASTKLGDALGIEKRDRRWMYWIANAVHCCVHAANVVLDAKREKGIELLFGPEMDIEIFPDEFAHSTDPSENTMKSRSGYDFFPNRNMKADGKGPRWTAELKTNATTKDDALFLVYRDGRGAVRRVADIAQRTIAIDLPIKGWRMISQNRSWNYRADDGRVMAAVFDEETRRRFHLLRQEVCEVSGTTTEDDGEYLAVVNDDGEEVSIDRDRALSLFTA